LIFTRTKHRARDLAKHDYCVSAPQSNSQNQREKAINSFRDGKYDILVAAAPPRAGQHDARLWNGRALLLGRYIAYH